MSSFDFLPTNSIFSDISRSLLSAVSVALNDKVNAVLGSSISKAVGGINGSISKSTGGGVLGNILGTVAGQTVGNIAYGVAGNAVGIFSGTLNRSFTRNLTLIDKMGGIDGVGYNVPNLVSRAYTSSGNLIVASIMDDLIRSGVSAAGAAGVVLGSGLSNMFISDFFGANPHDVFFDNKAFLTPDKVIAQTLASRFSQNSLMFPADLRNYYIIFEFGEYTKLTPLKPGTFEPIGLQIVLPIPNNLVDQYDLNYMQTELGMFGGEVAGEVQDIYKRLEQANFSFEQITQEGKTLTNSVIDFIAGKDLGGSAEFKAALARRGLKQLNESLGHYIDIIRGEIPNPHLAIGFQSVNFKSHNFSWKLTPNSLQESNTIRNIIKQFKVHSAPIRNEGYFLKYPSVVRTTLYTKNIKADGLEDSYLFSFKPSVIESLAVNFNGSGTLSFHKSGAPTEVDLTLRLREIIPWFREDYEGDTPGDSVSDKFENLSLEGLQTAVD